MVYIAILIATAVVTSHPAGAVADPSPERRAAAHRLLQSLGAEDHRTALLDGSIDHLLRLSSPSCAGVAVIEVRTCAAGTPAGKVVIDSMSSGRAELLRAVAEAQELSYAKRLTVSEMDAAGAFASTPAGRRFFTEAPDAGAEITNAVNALLLTRFEKALATAQPKADTVVDPVQ
ncbi:DUF2059 domain-containing protein [Sphingomonas sp. Leaf357]|uniref:DUF2059 domain-containing protein n=1 Tax=Sphingomonas sp. Leaf357 TaxID=1736350 RepID=UPI0012E108E2|nr:DUF2059 domain-containing protein [Sphingomonas sp. Leaf357]